MSDQERLDRLTELARLVYGPEAVLHCYCEPEIAWSVRVGESIKLFVDGVNSKGALEAALLVLAGDREARRGPSEEMFNDAMRRCMELEGRLGNLELLAQEWEEHGKLRCDLRAAAAQLECARELRQRAKSTY